MRYCIDTIGRRVWSGVAGTVKGDPPCYIQSAADWALSRIGRAYGHLRLLLFRRPPLPRAGQSGDGGVQRRAVQLHSHP